MFSSLSRGGENLQTDTALGHDYGGILCSLDAKDSSEAQEIVEECQGQKNMEMLVNWHPTRELSGQMEGSGRSQQLLVTQIDLIANFLTLSAHIWAVTDIGWSLVPAGTLVLPRRYTA